MIPIALARSQSDSHPPYVHCHHLLCLLVARCPSQSKGVVVIVDSGALTSAGSSGGTVANPSVTLPSRKWKRVGIRIASRLGMTHHPKRGLIIPNSLLGWRAIKGLRGRRHCIGCLQGTYLPDAHLDNPDPKRRERERERCIRLWSAQVGVLIQGCFRGWPQLPVEIAGIATVNMSCPRHSCEGTPRQPPFQDHENYLQDCHRKIRETCGLLRRLLLNIADGTETQLHVSDVPVPGCGPQQENISCSWNTSRFERGMASLCHHLWLQGCRWPRAPGSLHVSK